jgi:hypothetical protein
MRREAAPAVRGTPAFDGPGDGPQCTAQAFPGGNRGLAAACAAGAAVSTIAG